MMRGMAVLAALLVALVSASGFQGVRQEAPASTGTPAAAAPSQRELLNKYCVSCHNEKLKTANLMLDKMDVDKVTEHPEIWEKVIRKLRTGAMPPSGSPRPDAAGYDSLAGYL